MGQLIDKSYFIGRIDIPNTDVEESRLNLFINTYESKFLTELLGYSTYSSFIDDIDYDTDPPTASITPYREMLSGSLFTDLNGDRNRWGGFVNIDLGTEYKTSPIADFVYWEWMRQSLTKNAGVGVVEAKVENSTLVSPTALMADAWNSMVEQLWIFNNYVNQDATIKAALPNYSGFKYPPILNPTNSTELYPNQQYFINQNGWF